MLHTLIAFALEAESDNQFTDLANNVVYTGVGKVNAAHALTLALAQKPHCNLVINMGTAGSQVFKTGEVVCIHRFMQHDMDVSPLGFAVGETPFDAVPAIIETNKVLPHLPAATCASGDRFVTGNWPKDADVLDMEAYAMAKVCLKMNVPFLCLKYISDGADDSAATDWPTALKNAAKALRDVYNAHYAE